LTGGGERCARARPVPGAYKGGGEEFRITERKPKIEEMFAYRSKATRGKWGALEDEGIEYDKKEERRGSKTGIDK